MPALVANAAPIHRAFLNLLERVRRGHGRQGTRRGLVVASIKEMAKGLSRTPITTLYIESIVGADNDVSHKIASKVLSGMPTPITDEVFPRFNISRRSTRKQRDGESETPGGRVFSPLSRSP